MFPACTDPLAQCHPTQREILLKIMSQHGAGFPQPGVSWSSGPSALECRPEVGGGGGASVTGCGRSAAVVWRSMREVDRFSMMKMQLRRCGWFVVARPLNCPPSSTRSETATLQIKGPERSCDHQQNRQRKRKQKKKVPLQLAGVLTEHQFGQVAGAQRFSGRLQTEG